MRRRARRWIGPALLAGSGVALVTAPWVSGATAMPLPGRFAAAGPAVDLALAAVDRVDAACRRGDVGAFQAAVSGDFAGGVERKLRWLGKRMDPRGLRTVVGKDGAFGLAAELRARPCRGGAVVGDTAVVLFDLGDPRQDGGYPVRPGLKALVLRWNGRRLLLHAVQEQVLRPGDDREAAAQGLLQDWLGRR